MQVFGWQEYGVRPAREQRVHVGASSEENCPSRLNWFFVGAIFGVAVIATIEYWAYSGAPRLG